MFVNHLAHRELSVNGRITSKIGNRRVQTEERCHRHQTPNEGENDHLEGISEVAVEEWDPRLVSTLRI